MCRSALTVGSVAQCRSSTTSRKGCLDRQPPDELGDGLEHDESLVGHPEQRALIARPRWRLGVRSGEAGDQGCERPDDPAQLPSDHLDVHVPQALAHRLRDRLQGLRCRFVAPSEQHEPAGPMNMSSELRRDTALTDSGFTAQRDEVRSSAQYFLPAGVERRQQLFTTDARLRTGQGQCGGETDLTRDPFVGSRRGHVLVRLPRDVVGGEGCCEPLQVERADREKLEIGPRAGEQPHDVGHENLVTGRGRLQTSSLDDRCAEVVVPLERDVTGTQPDPDRDREIAVAPIAVDELLHLDRTRNPFCGALEDSHDAVAGVLHPCATVSDNRSRKDVIVLSTQLVGSDITEARTETRGADQVREQHGTCARGRKRHGTPVVPPSRQECRRNANNAPRCHWSSEAGERRNDLRYSMMNGRSSSCAASDGATGAV